MDAAVKEHITLEERNHKSICSIFMRIINKNTTQQSFSEEMEDDNRRAAVGGYRTILEVLSRLSIA